MAKLKMLKYGKKPKASASVQVKENYLAKCKAIDKENAHRSALNKKSEHLSKVIAGLTQKSHGSHHHHTAKRKKAAPKKAAKKAARKTARRRK